MSSNLQASISELVGVGPSLQAKLNGLGILSVADLLFHLPRQYQDRSRSSAIGQVRLGQFVCVEGRVIQTQVNMGKRRSLLCTIEDDSAAITLRFFHFNKAQQSALSQGRLMRCFGEVRQGPRGAEITHPEYQLDPEPLSQKDAVLTSIYPSTMGISQNIWRKLQVQALQRLRQSEDNLALIELPPSLQFLQCELKDALEFLHQPPNSCSLADIEQGRHIFQQRLAFEELLAHQISLLQVRQLRQEKTAPVLQDQQLAKQLLAALPFQLTAAQARSFHDIQSDCQHAQPMLRLIQGDVGSGKTVVAALAASLAVAEGFQVAIMAPTEILASQHLESFLQWFTALDVTVDSLLGRHTPKQKREIVERLSAGSTQIIIGTHAIFQEHVLFNRLGLVIIDEQHRFGVHQRLALQDKGKIDNFTPHQLIMTATPIPRTLAMTAYADLDLSLIDELPPGRKPINTLAMAQHRREEIIQRIRAHCETGQQIYWVCTLIEESETLNCQAAEKTAELLKLSLPGINIGLVHGRLKPKDKQQIMHDFTAGLIQLLVATTVIEVGVNVPNTSLMIIENPERLGLAQLHQLRGRIGRGDLQSHCLLLYQTPLSRQAKERINIMRETNDGFKIAETDLRLRGPGEVLGSRQTGLLNFRIADIERDALLIAPISEFAKQLMAAGHDNSALIKRWIFNAEHYAQA